MRACPLMPFKLPTLCALVFYTGWTGTFAKTSLNGYNSKTTRYMIILMTFLEILKNFAYINYTLVKQKSNYLVFFVFLKCLCMQPK